MAGNKPKLRVGLVGAGFMGRCHANAFRSVGGIFDLPAEVELAWLADIDEETASRNAVELGFERSTGDWRSLATADDVDIVAITAPNSLHEPIALEAINCGKSVYCEKPLAPDGEAARRMRQAAEAAGVQTVVGYNFLSNPLISLAREMIENGEIGDITSFRGRHAEDYFASRDAPHTFRTDPEGGGALADLGSHIVSLARHLVGRITDVAGDLTTIVKERPVSNGSSEMRPVAVDDMAHALIRFESGAGGSIEANWAASGRTMDLSFEVTGSAGSISFTQERMNELLVCTSRGRKSGFTKIEAGPCHPPYDRFCPAPGHQLGFNDLKVIEVSRLVNAIMHNKPTYPDFAEACRIQETIDAIRASSLHRAWKTV